MATVSERQFDIIVLGATGYTGKYVVEQLAKLGVTTSVKWAVAGRNIEKVKASLSEVQNVVEDGDWLKNIRIIEADVQDEDSLNRMCQKSRLILNCVGPYIFTGEPVVKACIENGTHHVDISGEPKYLEGVQAKYFQKAQDKGVYIVQSCGFDSIPADLGTAILKKKSNGDVHSVEIFVKLKSGPEGRVTNIGTFMSSVNAIADIFHAKEIRNNLKDQIFTKKMPDYAVGHPLSAPVSYYGDHHRWCVPLAAPDVPVLQRTQMFNYEFLDEPPIQEMKVFMSAGSLVNAIGLVLMLTFIGGMSLFSFGRYLLGKFPRIFTFGYFSAEGPSRTQVLDSSVEMTLYANGYSDKTAKPSNLIQEEAVLQSRREKRLGLKVTGPDPAYVLTAICMVNAGLVILEEADKMPLDGGVITPGAAFANTTLVDRLQAKGIKFELIE